MKNKLIFYANVLITLLLILAPLYSGYKAGVWYEKNYGALVTSMRAEERSCAEKENVYKCEHKYIAVKDLLPPPDKATASK